MNSTSNENISYYVNEYENEDDNENNIDLTNLLNEFEQINVNNNIYDNDTVISEIQNYDLNYTIKQLLLICDYYGLTKHAKLLKKCEIISLIMMFEKNTENIDIVVKRKRLWFYLNELKKDKNTKKFVLW